jgi:hypothetical protein
MTREREGIRILGGVVTCLAIPVVTLGIVAMRGSGGHNVTYLAWIGGLMFLAGVAAFRGSRVAAIVISAMSAIGAVTLLGMLARTLAVGTSAIVANVIMAVLLVLPAVVTIMDLRARSR